MYKIKCDGALIFDARNEKLVVFDPYVNVETNTVGECGFTIYADHPRYNDLIPLKSVFEVTDDFGVLFRGRMTRNTRNYLNGKTVDIEGVMAYFNDSKVRPFTFPEDYLDNTEYKAEANGGNVIKFFLKMLVDNHNSQTQDFQHFKLGNVTVTDPNNYLSRNNEGYLSTWEVLQQKLFDSSLGGYLCIRYEADGNYIDYLSDFEEENEQSIEFGKNLIDFIREMNAEETYTAIIPIGAEIETESEDGKTSERKRLTIENIADGEVADGIYKKGDTLYSSEAVAQYGWIYAPSDLSTWDDVFEVKNLVSKGVKFFDEWALLSDTFELSAIDLHLTGADVESFRINKKVRVIAKPQGVASYNKLTRMEIPLQYPQNAKFIVGERRKTLTETIIKNPAGKDGKDGIDATTLRIDSSRGTVFKNSEVSTVLSAVIYKGSKRITDIDALHAEFGTSAYLEWKWQRMGEEIFGTILSSDSRIGNGGFTFTLTPDDVDTKVVFMCQLITD